VKKNQAQALKLYSQACRMRPKVAPACLKLARVHETGAGVEIDQNAAWNYYRDACELGSHEGCIGWHTDGCDRLKNPVDCDWLKKHGLY
jgi:TPR repeat protein